MAFIYRWDVGGATTTLGLSWQFSRHYQTAVGLDGVERPIADIHRELMEAFSLTAENLQLFTNTLRADNVLQFSRLREELDPASTDLPEQHDKTFNLPGTIGAMTGDKLPIEACIWARLNTATASRSSRGGFHLPPVLDPAHLDSNGRWSTSILDSADMNTLEAKLSDVLEDVIGTLDLIPIIYSRTRRARGQSPYTFDVTGAVYSSKVRWIRRRGIAP